MLYQNCTRILGALVINDLTDADDTSFLDSIEEVYGFVDIYNNSFTSITLPKLRLIRGQSILSSKYALEISSNPGLQYFFAPNLRSIQTGTVALNENPQMRCANNIGWTDMMAGRTTPPILKANTGVANPCKLIL